MSFCGCEISYAAGSAGNIPESCREVPIFVDWSTYTSTSLTRMQAQRAFVRGFAEWHSYLDVRLYLTASRDQGFAKVVWTSFPNNVLATSNMADGTCDRTKTQGYSNDALWTEHLLFLVVVHEVGHLLGLPHLPGKHVMSAGIQTDLQGLTAGDVDAAVALGYVLKETPPEAPEGVSAEELVGALRLLRQWLREEG